MPTPVKRRTETMAIALGGVAVFWALGLPLPFLFGPMFACLAAALLGRPLLGFPQVALGARTILGVAVGASVTPEVVAMLPQMALSLLMMPFYILLIALVGVPFFHRVYGFDRATAYYASMPGGLQEMITFGQEAGGDVRALALIHATRVLVIVSVAPLVLSYAFDAGLTGPIGVPLTSVPWQELALMAAAALIGWKVGERIGLFGASILGPMILTAILSLSGLIHARPPAEAINFAQLMVGILVSVGYVGVTGPELRRDVAAGGVFVLILAVLAAGFAEVVVLIGAAPPMEGFLAFAPGGQAEMAILSIAAGADLGFVIIHHLARLILVITGAPLAARWLMRARSGGSG